MLSFMNGKTYSNVIFFRFNSLSTSKCNMPLTFNFYLTESQANSSHAILNPGEDDEMVVVGYQRSTIKTAICWFCFIITGGLLRLFMHWWKHWFLLATHECCPLEYAQKVLVSEHYEGKHTVHYVKDVITLNAETMKLMQLEKDKWLDLVPFEDGTDDFPVKLSIHFQGGIFKCKL